MFRGKCVFVVLCFLGSTLFAADYPIGPDITGMTPGSLCTTPDSYRYPERVAYCDRGVKREEKWQIINAYNGKFGYKINSANRGQFKIDHLIPLCAGGSNEPSNLWPQHQSIFAQTDPLEPLACEKMKTGRLKQVRAVELLMRAKLDLSKVRAVQAELESL